MKFSLFAFLSLLLVATSMQAATPEQLDTLVKSGAKVTIIDLRTSDEYQRSHIAGALHIPHQLIPGRRLPPLGRVVVYCDGLGSTYAATSVAELNAKPGIQAEALEGGYAGWKTYTNVTADTRHITPEQPLTITYEQLKATQGEGVVLVDVRKPQSATLSATGRPRVNLSSFRQRTLPKAGSLTDPVARLKTLKNRDSEFRRAPSLFVVVDDDHQAAMKTAGQIRAMGYHRVVVLAGGEEIIRRDGKSGLGRQGGSAPVTQQPELVPPPVQAQ